MQYFLRAPSDYKTGKKPFSLWGRGGGPWIEGQKINPFTVQMKFDCFWFNLNFDWMNERIINRNKGKNLCTSIYSYDEYVCIYRDYYWNVSLYLSHTFFKLDILYRSTSELNLKTKWSFSKKFHNSASGGGGGQSWKKGPKFQLVPYDQTLKFLT